MKRVFSDEVLRETDCPTCRSRKGKPCISTRGMNRGREMKRAHSERKTAWEREHPEEMTERLGEELRLTLERMTGPTPTPEGTEELVRRTRELTRQRLREIREDQERQELRRQLKREQS